jgi:hypothetical protein
MGGVFSNENQYQPKYNIKDYTKRRPGRNIYKVDNNRVYWRGERVNGAHGYNFVDIGNGYGKDNKYVFYKGFKIKNAYPLSFKVLTNKYAKDYNNIYYKGVIVKANVNSFRITKKGRALDNSYIYKEGIRSIKR